MVFMLTAQCATGTSLRAPINRVEADGAYVGIVAIIIVLLGSLRAAAVVVGVVVTSTQTSKIGNDVTAIVHRHGVDV